MKDTVEIMGAIFGKTHLNRLYEFQSGWIKLQNMLFHRINSRQNCITCFIKDSRGNLLSIEMQN
jgi:hypothetical protein